MVEVSSDVSDALGVHDVNVVVLPEELPGGRELGFAGRRHTDLVTNSIILCWLFTINDWCEKVRLQQTHYQSLRQLFLMVSWECRA